jgi:hypothetical protein
MPKPELTPEKDLTLYPRGIGLQQSPSANKAKSGPASNVLSPKEQSSQISPRDELELDLELLRVL